MSLPQTDLLGVAITTADKTRIVKEVAGYLSQKKSRHPFVIVTPNPEQIVLAQKDEEFRNVLYSADIALPDGAGVVWAMKIQNYNSPQPPLTKRGRGEVVERIPGIEFIEELVKLAAEKGYPVAFIGGRGGTALRSLTLLKKKYPGLKGWGEEPPEMEVRSSKIENRSKKEATSNYELLTTNSEMGDQYFEQLAKKIKTNGIRLVFIGLGVPKQEYFIAKLKLNLSLRAKRSNLKGIAAATLWPRNDSLPIILMSVGGAFDTISGKLPRAPGILRQANLEWLWRLGLEPWRVKRQLQLLKFLVLVLKHRFVI